MSRKSISQSRPRRGFADIALLITAVALVVSLAVAAIAISIGIARADTLAQVADSGGGQLAAAMFVALVITGIGGLTAAMVKDGTSPPRRD
jgi:hypothetical protein